MKEAPIKRDPADWDRFFFGLAIDAADLSKDPDRKVGAALVTPDRRQLSIGYNGFPPELEDLPSLLNDRAFKNAHMVHAEDNCLRQAPFNPRGCFLYVTRFPCLPCADKVVAAGVVRLVAPKPDFGHLRWGQSWALAWERMSDAGVAILTYEELEK